MDAIVDEEYRRLLGIQASSELLFKDDPTAAIDNLKEAMASYQRGMAALRDPFVLSGQVIWSVVRRTLQRKVIDAELASAINALQRGDYSSAQESYDMRTKDGDDTAAEALGETDKGKTARLKRTMGLKGPGIALIYQYARLFAGIASVVVVSLVGLKLQYLDNQAFDGSMSAWVTLGLWGLAVELSGVSIIDVLSRLGSSSPATSPSNLVAK